MRLRDNGSPSTALRLQVAAVDKLHLTVDGRSLCGLLTVDALDVYGNDVGLRAWNGGPLEQCTQCRTTLVTRIRRPRKRKPAQQTPGTRP